MIRSPDDVFADPSYVEASVHHRRPTERVITEYLRALESLIGRSDTHRPVILDVGCGAGAFTIPLARLVEPRQGRVIALDKSAAMLDVVQRRVAERGMDGRVITRAGDFLSARLPKSVALLWASDVLHLIADVDAFAARARRLLAPGGALAIRMSSHAQLRSYEWGRFFPEALTLDVSRHHETGAVCASLARHGFGDLQVGEIDESRWMPTEWYVRQFESRYLSSLRLIDETSFQRGLAAMKRAVGSSSRTLRNGRTTLISARVDGAG